MMNKEELGMLIENFEAFTKRCYKTFDESCDNLSHFISSAQKKSDSEFVDDFQSRLTHLYILEKQAKSKIFRKIHQTVLCLNSLIIQHFSEPPVNRQSFERKNLESTQTQFKFLIKSIDTSIYSILKENSMGSLELIFNRILTNREDFLKMNRDLLLKMVKECSNGNYEFTVDKLYKRSRKRSMRYSNSYNFISSRNSNVGGMNPNFLDYDSMDYGRNAPNNLSYVADNNGVLTEQSEFYDVSIDIVLNYLQMNKILLLNYIPNISK